MIFKTSHQSSEPGLYRPDFERANCGVGFVVRLNNLADHEVVRQASTILQNMSHRGAAGGDEDTGDGAGIMLQVPDTLLRMSLSADLPPAGAYGAAMVFMPRAPAAATRCRGAVEQEAAAAQLPVLAWRQVPLRGEALGAQARNNCPDIMQCVVTDQSADPDTLEQRLFCLRRRIERRLESEPDFYIVSCSSRTMVYKGLMMAAQLPEFYPDLQNPATTSTLALVHQRFSTNTFPSWPLAQPFRCLAHNGEINTLRGNLSQMSARERALRTPHLPALSDLLPVLDRHGSDSACLDSAMELLMAAGRDMPHALLILIPGAWGAKYPMGPDLRGFFEYHAGLMEPWDGPATVLFSNGRRIGALLDRNGLRPARYTLTTDDRMILASEDGVLDLPPEQILRRGSLRPGQMLIAAPDLGRIIYDGEIKAACARRQPYRRWVDENKITLHGFFDAVAPLQPDRAILPARQRLFGYTREDLRLIIEPMASQGQEAVGSMGNDAPLAVFSEQPQLLFNYFRQLFAQVTNPPLDPIREELVMSLMTFIGNAPNILEENPRHARLIKLRHPILTNEDVQRIRTLNEKAFAARTLPIGFPRGGDGQALETALRELATTANATVRGGAPVLILSDRDLPPELTPIPSLLAVSAVNQQLRRAGIRTGAGLIVETGEAREVMHMALLLGFGATAINPYLAFETVAQMALDEDLRESPSVAQALDNYIHALCKGLLKIMSKMGISTLRSYRGAQVFEAVGLSRKLTEEWFGGCLSRVDGAGLAEIATAANARRQAADSQQVFLPTGGAYQYRADGERHLWTPQTIHKLQQAARRNDTRIYREYSALINNQADRCITLRGAWRLRPAPVPLALDEVEPAAGIVRRFVTGAMSLGSLSPEAHETIAMAMNRLQAASNSGEGGEDPARYHAPPGADNRCSAIKQIASGRFGVTTAYLVNARELQIKISQGAKPGEGGQLPGHKVDLEIARVRHSTPGVTLISPPPHHDIYSIEDLAQLIHDLRVVNPTARISVKLVAEAGVGAVAAGVVKAGADMILISGADGGTGAAPLSSIKYAGIPWEIGLAETQQTLTRNGLRKRVRLQADGQLRTGRDVVIAALLGAEEFGFATAPLVVCGCVMMRKCHQNTCPVGVATQNPELRRRFAGRPEHLVNFFTMLAEEVRELLATLGLRSLDEAIGRTDLLEPPPPAGAHGMDYSAILKPLETPPVRHDPRQCPPAPVTLDRQFWPAVEEAMNHNRPFTFEVPIRNTDRAVGAALAGELARMEAALPQDFITGNFHGVAGQSFGAFAVQGMTLTVTGAVNDYLGKGLAGGRLIVKPAVLRHDPDDQPDVIAGNTLLYGATSGEVYLAGAAGERFAVRNSGAHAVVEGVGSHGCEYMTGGRVVVLGPTGLNFGAGMSGGLAYVLDANRDFDNRCNLDMVDLESLTDAGDEQELLNLIRAHHRYTGSRRAGAILNDWEVCRTLFVKVFPMEYRRVLGQMSQADQATHRPEVSHG
ncbi:MAG: glutamate synthase large subunit [Kiritimatiellia bacterium]